MKTFRGGDVVYLLKEPQVNKFNAQHVGPYEILQLVGETNAEIKVDANRTKIVHLNKLKLATLPPNRDAPDVGMNNG